jgi:hypothetical protein
MLGEIETSAETWAVAEDHRRLRLGLCARYAILQRSEQPVVDGVSLLRPVEAKPGHAFAQFVRDNAVRSRIEQLAHHGGPNLLAVCEGWRNDGSALLYDFSLRESRYTRNIWGCPNNREAFSG